MDLRTKISQEEQYLLRQWNLQLYKEYDHICYSYKLTLKPIIIIIKDLRTSFGHWCPKNRSIALAKSLLQKYSWNITIEILKHEMAHQYVSEIFYSGDSHQEDFQRACKILRVEPWARRATIKEDHTNFKREKTLDKKEEKLLRWINKLLSLASSANENEALAAIKKVHLLYKKHNIEQIVQNKDQDYKIRRVNHHKKRIEHFQVLISNILINHFMVKVIYSFLYNPKKLCEEKIIEIIGTSTNVEMAEYVYWFLYNQAKLIWHEYKKKHGKKGARAKNIFYQGLLEGFDDQLNNLKKNESREQTVNKEQNTLLAIKGEKSLLSYVKYQYPRLSTTSRYSTIGMGECYQQGKKIGSRLKLHKGLNNKNTTSIKFISRIAKL